MTLEEAVDTLPPYLREAVGDVIYPNDNGMHLAQHINEGDTIHAWSDGSVKDNNGAHAYTIRTSDDNPDHCIIRRPGQDSPKRTMTR